MKERSQWSRRSPEECYRSNAQLVDQQRNSREPKHQVKKSREIRSVVGGAFTTCKIHQGLLENETNKRAFRFGRRILPLFPVIPSGYPARYHRKETKQNQNQQKSIESYTMQHPQVRSGQVRSGHSRNNGPSASSLEGSLFPERLNLQALRLHVKSLQFFLSGSLCTLPCPNFPLYLPKSGRYSSTAWQLCLPDFGTLVQFSFSSFIILFHHHFSLLPLSDFFYVSFIFFLFIFFSFFQISSFFILLISFYLNLIINKSFINFF